MKVTRIAYNAPLFGPDEAPTLQVSFKGQGTGDYPVSEAVELVNAALRDSNGNPFADNLEFMQACSKPRASAPTLDVPTEAMQWGLIVEEFNETVRARQQGDLVEVADGLIDIIKVVTEYGETLGLPMQALWDEVHRSNMAKVDPITGSVKRRDDGKILKPEGWTRPDIAKVLGL